MICRVVKAPLLWFCLGLCLFVAGDKAVSVKTPSVDEILTSYFTNEEMEAFMKDFTTTRCPDISRMFSIGKSVLGTELWVLEISSNPGTLEAKPNFKYVANMHGDEPSGRQLLLKLADWLCSEWKENKEASKIVEGMHMYLMPTLNPDGYTAVRRNNKQNIDLNRNFPDRFRKKGEFMEPSGDEAPETFAMMSWIQKGNFVGSGNLHEGALLANYPWDGNEAGVSKYAACPDDKTFIHLSKTYANAHLTMHKSEEFEGGITNGNDWFTVYGSMQDYNYIVGDCFELTLELNKEFRPPADQLERLWKENKQAFIDFALVTVFGGFRGFVLDEEKTPLHAEILVHGIDKSIHSKSEFGDFYRPLAPDTYNITISAFGYETTEFEIVIPEDRSGYERNITLRKIDEEPAKKLRTMNANEMKTITPQTNWILLLSIFASFSLFVTYGIQTIRKRTHNRTSRFTRVH